MNYEKYAFYAKYVITCFCINIRSLLMSLTACSRNLLLKVRVKIFMIVKIISKYYL